jgi:antitoxin ParD1/3/4
MAKTEMPSVTLTDDQIAALEAAVATGEYATTGDALRDAIGAWQRERDTRRTEAERIGRLWDAGVASGSAGPVDLQAARQDARTRLAAARKAAGDAG